MTSPDSSADSEPDPGTQTEGPQSEEAQSEAPRSGAKRSTAFHEAGHAVMALYLERDVQKVTIAAGHLDGGGMRLGMCQMKKGRSKKRRDSIEDDALVLIAGMVAESMVTGRYCEQGARQDLFAVQRLLESRSRTERELARNMRRLIDKAEHILAEPACELAIQRLAEQLLESTSVGGRQAKHLFNMAVQESAG